MKLVKPFGRKAASAGALASKVQEDWIKTSSTARRSRMLNGILLSLIALLAVTLVSVLVHGFGPQALRFFYTAIILAILVALLVAYALNKRGYYTVSAVVLISLAYIGPWASVIYSQITASGDFIPLIFTALTIFLCAMLLSLRATILMTLLQVLGIAALLAMIPDLTVINWQSLVAFICFSSTLGIVYGHMHQKDYNQIEEQARRLLENEKQLREMTVRDALTGLFNWRYMTESLDVEISRACRRHTCIGVMLLDIDRFKHINDQFGHLAGDAILERMGKFLQSKIRAGDIACRYGGDEFVLILPDATLDTTLSRAEEICSEVRINPILQNGEPGLSVTCSIGVAAYPNHGETGQSLLAAADAALYLAKESGRNRIIAAG